MRHDGSRMKGGSGDARETLPAGRGRRSSTAAYYAASAAIGLGSAALGPTLPALASQTGVSLAQAGLLFTARSLGSLIGSLVAASPIDRGRGHLLLFVSLLAAAGVMALVPAAPTFVILALLLFVLGAAHTALSVGLNTLLVWTHRDRVGPFMNGLHFFYGVGSLFTPILVAQVLPLPGGAAWAYWTVALLTLPLALSFLGLPAPAGPAVQEGASRERLDRLLAGIIVLFFFLYTGAEVAFGGWIFSWAIGERGIGEAAAAYLTSAFWGSFALGRLLSIPLMIRLRSATILLASLFGVLVSVGVLWVFGGSSGALWGATFGVGLSMACVFPGTLALAGTRVAMTGRIASAVFVASSAGAMILPWLIGELFGSVGPRVMMPAILIDLVLTLVSFGLLLVRSRQTTHETAS
jgi:FHS family Na+ dependent glucose MFS transporter 1